MKAKVLIIGGGVVGTAIAMKAAQRTDPLKAPVVLVEKSELGAGSSGRSGAILRQLYADRELAVMARDSLREYASFEARTGRSIGFQRTGCLTLAGPDQPEWCQKIRDYVADLNELGIRADLVEGGGLRELVPNMNVKPGSVGAWEHHGGFVDPHLTVQGFAAMARNYGAVTRLGVEAQEILVEGGRVVGARTSEGEVRAETVVLVAGPWSGALLESLGVKLPLRIARPENHFFGMVDSGVAEENTAATQQAGFHFDIEDPAEKSGEVDTLRPAGLHASIIDLENDSYLRCEPLHLRSRVGRTDYDQDEILERPEDLNEEVGDAARDWAREVLVRRMPEYEEQPDAGSIAAWYTLTPDAQAVLGPIATLEGLYVATGFSGHGFKLAPSVGEGIAQMIFGEPVTAFEPEFFSPARFTGDEPWGGRFGL